MDSLYSSNCLVNKDGIQKETEKIIHGKQA